MTDYRNRIMGLERIRAGDLIPSPLNYRTHSEAQRGSLASVLGFVGKVKPVVGRRLEGGAVALIDGHLRSEMDPDEIWPVLVTDLSEDEANTVLATMDAIGSMAVHDVSLLAQLTEGMEFDGLDKIVGPILTEEDWRGVEPVNPEDLPEYDPEAEVVTIRLAVPHNHLEETLEQVREAVKECGMAYEVESK